MSNVKIYCVTNKEVNFIKKKNYFLSWVGNGGNSPAGYIKCDNLDNIFHKEKNYSELTFHYWYWKNLLDKEDDNCWIGFCQKRRYWIKENFNNIEINNKNINDFLLSDEGEDWSKFESIICNPITIKGAKKIKLIKKGWRNILKNPKLLFGKNQENLMTHFDMHHGFGNLKKAINFLDDNDKYDFLNYVNENDKFNPHIMFISKKKITKKWFETLFLWLDRCEKEFGFKNLKGYETTRLYAYLAERYLSFWFKKYTDYKEQHWTFIDV